MPASAVDILSFSNNAALFDALRQLDPVSCHRVMCALREVELNQEQESIDITAADIVPVLAALPRIAEIGDADDLARRIARTRLRGLLDDSFLAVYARDHERLLPVLEFEGDRVVTELIEAGRSPVLLALNFRILGGVSLLAEHRFPFTFLGQFDLAAMMRTVLGSQVGPICFESIVLPDPLTVTKCLASLRRGLPVAGMPSITSAEGRNVIEVDFLGAQVAVQAGLVLLARLAGVPVVPFSFRRTGQALYTFRFHDALEPDDATTVIGRYFSIVEDELGREPEEWAGWDYMETVARKRAAATLTS